MRPKYFKDTRHEEAKPEIPLLPLEKCLAKTRKVGDSIVKGCTVEAHSAAALLTAKALLRYFSQYRSGAFFRPQDLLAVLLHDVGKVSLAFQAKLYDACHETPMPLWNGKHYLWNKERHCVTSSLTLEQLGLTQIAKIANSHHGWEYDSGSLEVDDEVLGGQAWEDLRESLVDRLCKRFELSREDIPKDKQRQPLVLGLTILADWLSSGLELEYGEEATEAMAEQTVRNAGFVPFAPKQGLTFEKVFPFQANPVQAVMGDLADSSFLFPEDSDSQTSSSNAKKSGSTVVLEMEMGGGKTEAALYLAYRLMAKHGHNGVYFALPTRLTSDKIYDRFKPFLEKILSEESQKHEALLLHGDAWLQQDLHHAGDDGFQATSEVRVDDWFNARKRGLLAPFAVGTVDQLLMSVIHVKHSALRALGAAGKVVILDEIHSYDAYTGKLIQRLVERLRNWGCSVIILSATLTNAARALLLGQDASSLQKSEAYPLLSVSDGQRVVYPEIPSDGTTTSKQVQFRWSHSLETSLENARKHAQNGECVLWIENTVDEAQHVFRCLKAMAPEITMGLIHSRFPAFIRQEKEEKWVRLYGKDAGEERAGGKILVGTQVLEQSIDIDADYLITRLCPMDMLLQRVGRLWRHRSLDAIRAKTAECTVEILNESPFENREKPERDEELRTLPYPAYVLMRTQEVLEKWQEQQGVIAIPEDIRPMLEATYAERKETGRYAYLKQKMTEKTTRLERLADVTDTEALAVLDDTEAVTRWDDEETVDVLLIKDYDPVHHLMALYDPTKKEGRTVFQIPSPSASRKDRVECTMKLSRYMIRVRKSLAPSYEGVVLDDLKHVLYIGHDKNRPLRAAFVGADGRLQDRAKQPIKDSRQRELYYSKEQGYVAKKTETEKKNA